MPVHIDHIDSEIEILPSAMAERSHSRTPSGANMQTHASRPDLRLAVTRALEEELQEYLRIRG